jgi:hypothetical protein
VGAVRPFHFCPCRNADILVVELRDQSRIGGSVECNSYRHVNIASIILLKQKQKSMCHVASPRSSLKVRILILIKENQRKI